MHVANIVTIVAAVVVGLFAGTYATTLIARLRDDEPVRPAGRCPECGERLRWGEMIPIVSYATRRGRCAYCGKAYGRRHLTTELVTAALFGLAGLRFGASPELAAYLYMTFAGVVLSGVDFDTKRLPDVLNKPSYLVVGGLLAIAVPWVPHGPLHFVYAVLGMIGALVLYFVLWLVNPNGMAWGDVKLSGTLGLLLGWLGVSAWLTGLAAAGVFGALYAVYLAVLGRQKVRAAFPFGPFMCLGALAGVLVSAAVRLPV